MSRHSLLLTFDYEVFLGNKSGTIENCLLHPTNEVLKILKNKTVNGLFFIDTLYLLRLEKEPSAICYAELNQIYKQLENIVAEGHTIGIHIHPHWLDSSYEAASNNWNGINKTRFALSNLNPEEKQSVIHESVRILKPFMDETKIKTYRAGGFYCQPFNSFSDYFAAENILLDFSVMREFTSTGFNSLYSFDFSNPPKKFIYHFENDPLKPDANGRFIEVSVNSFRLEGLTKVRNSLYYRKTKSQPDHRMMGDGKGSGNFIAHKHDSSLLRRLRNHSSFSIELMNPVLAEGYAKHLKKEGYLHFVSHPKLFTAAGLKSFEHFLDLTDPERPETDYREIIRQYTGKRFLIYKENPQPNKDRPAAK